MPALSLIASRIRTACLVALLLGAVGLHPAAAAGRVVAPAVLHAAESRGTVLPVQFEHLWPGGIAAEAPAGPLLVSGPPVFLPALAGWAARRPLALPPGPAARPRAVVCWFRQRMLLASLSPHAP